MADEPADHAYRWVDTQAGFAELLDELAEEPLYGLDTEFHRERTYFPHLALLQLSWASGIALVDPLAVDVAPLARVLAGNRVAVLHASEQDLEVLVRECGAMPSRLFDTQLAAGFLGMSSPSLSNLAERLLGRRILKADRLTDWTQRPLSPGQRAYAAADVAYLLDLRSALVRRLEELGRLEWAEEECELVLRRAGRTAPPEEAWWRLRNARQLRKRARAVAQEVAAWRERLAIETDRPARSILPDLALVSIAERPPASRDELRRVRGMSGRRLKSGTEAGLMKAIEAGMRLAEEEVHMPEASPPAKEHRGTTALGSAWVARRAAELRIDSSLLGTRSDLGDLLRGDPSARMANGWRWRLVGAQVALIASGEASLALDGRDGEVVLEARSRRPPPEPGEPGPEVPGRPGQLSPPRA
jgi:ribonuclease D